jgi:hypothetical protein
MLLLADPWLADANQCARARSRPGPLIQDTTNPDWALPASPLGSPPQHRTQPRHANQDPALVAKSDRGLLPRVQMRRPGMSGDFIRWKDEVPWHVPLYGG